MQVTAVFFGTETMVENLWQVGAAASRKRLKMSVNTPANGQHQLLVRADALFGPAAPEIQSETGPQLKIKAASSDETDPYLCAHQAADKDFAWKYFPCPLRCIREHPLILCHVADNVFMVKFAASPRQQSSEKNVSLAEDFARDAD